MRSRKWDTIEFPSAGDLELMQEGEILKTTLPSGFCIRFFRHDLQYLFTVPSNTVFLTRGVLDYLHDYSQFGPNKSRSKLFVCTHFDKNQSCMNGSFCREIHCSQSIDNAVDAALYDFPSNATGSPNFVKVAAPADIQKGHLHNVGHSNGVPPIDDGHLNLDESERSSASLNTFYFPLGLVLRHSLHSRWTSTKFYPTLPAGVLFKIALPNTPTPVDYYDSGVLLVTKGAQECYDQFMRNEPPMVTMQHCSHYSKNGICCFGEDCQFVHVLHYKPRERVDNEGSCSDADMGSSCTSSTADRRHNKGKRQGNSKETPLSIHVPGTVNYPYLPEGSESRSSSCAHNGNGQMTSMMRSNCVLVPANSWQQGTAAATMSQQNVVYSLPPAAQRQPQMMCPPGYVVMRSPGGEVFLVQQGSQATPQPQQQQQQQIFVMPMPYAQ